jgi:hypothetical protein
LVWNDDRVRVILIGSGIVFLIVTAALYRWATSLKDQLASQDDIVDPRVATGDGRAR